MTTISLRTLIDGPVIDEAQRLPASTSALTRQIWSIREGEIRHLRALLKDALRLEEYWRHRCNVAEQKGAK